MHNDGDAGLTVSVELTTPANDPDLDHWDETEEIADFAIAPGDPPLVLRQVYKPEALGDHDIAMRVTGTDAAMPTLDVSLVGEGVSPRPIDTTLVLDRSGSMDDLAGDRRKIEALRDAAMLYADLLREDVGGTGTGDGLGLVKYNQANGVHFPLTIIGPGTADSIAAGPLSLSAITDPAQLAPSGTTGIGGAMQTGADELGAPDPDRGQVLVVLTDGKENEAPFIDAAIADLQANHAEVQTYAVGLGFDIEPAKLQAITNMGDEGYHQVVSTLSEVTLFDLETFYFKIFSSAAGMDLVTDPTHVVDLSSNDAVVIDRATVISSDRSATFLVMEDPQMRGLYELEFVSPGGQVVSAGTVIGGVAVQERVRNTYRILRIVFPEPDQASDHLGDWLLRVRPNGNWSPSVARNIQAESRFGYGGKAIQPTRGTVPIGFAGAVSSDYRLEVDVTASSYLPGAELRLTAALTDRGWPAANGGVEVDVTSPSGTLGTVRLHDDGAHGDGATGDAVWSAPFAQTAEAGVYRLLFRARGTNERGELAPRLAERFVTLAQLEPTPDGDGGDGGDGGGGGAGGVSAYLIGSYDLRLDGRNLVRVLNPTGRELRVVIAVFDPSGQPLGCEQERIAPNGLVERDVSRLGPDAQLGVVKVLALDPERPEPVHGVAGEQIRISNEGHAEAPMHPVPRAILEGDIGRIRRACGF